MPPKVKTSRPAQSIDLSSKGDGQPLDLPPANESRTPEPPNTPNEAEIVSGDPVRANETRTNEGENPWAPPASVEVKTISINVPIFVPPAYPTGGAQSRRIDHVDVHLTQRQSEALCQLFSGIDKVPHLRLANGRPLYYQVDAVRWLLDQIAEQLPECAELPAAKNWE